jgi:hypothetical protein
VNIFSSQPGFLLEATKTFLKMHIKFRSSVVPSQQEPSRSKGLFSKLAYPDNRSYFFDKANPTTPFFRGVQSILSATSETDVQKSHYFLCTWSTPVSHVSRPVLEQRLTANGHSTFFLFSAPAHPTISTNNAHIYEESQKLAPNRDIQSQTNFTTILPGTALEVTIITLSQDSSNLTLVRLPAQHGTLTATVSSAFSSIVCQNLPLSHRLSLTLPQEQMLQEKAAHCEHSAAALLRRALYALPSSLSPFGINHRISLPLSLSPSLPLSLSPQPPPLISNTPSPNLLHNHNTNHSRHPHQTSQLLTRHSPKHNDKKRRKKKGGGARPQGRKIKPSSTHRVHSTSLSSSPRIYFSQAQPPQKNLKLKRESSNSSKPKPEPKPRR